MKIKTDDSRPDVKLITAESLDDAVFKTPAGDEIHNDLDCQHLQTEMEIVFGYTSEAEKVTCKICK